MPRFFPRVDPQRDRLDVAGIHEPVDGQESLAEHDALAEGEAPGQGMADHELDDLRDRDVGHHPRGRPLAVAQDRHAVADLLHLVEVV